MSPSALTKIISCHLIRTMPRHVLFAETELRVDIMEQLVVKGAKDFSKDQFGRTQVTSAEDMANAR